tara:strand:+ start:21 stop:146 length:126 start_codon:yes stop_codon:yes gene_type:complete
MKKDIKISTQLHNRLVAEAKKRKLTADELAELFIDRQFNLK